ncbi:MAG: short chain dehydrogenase [Myxococcales bacterium]|nr:short chain dehydrogenase [Myxococcales bacterium]
MKRPPPYPEARDLLKGRRVVVTAAAGTGIGFATAKRCLEEGADLLISDHHERRLNEAADELRGMGLGTVYAVACDVTDQGAVDGLFHEAEVRMGGLDVLVNNAGLGGMDPLITMEDSTWQRILDVSLTGTMRCTRAGMRSMMKGEGGAIINNASVLGWRAQKGQTHYAAAKAGVMALTRCAALEAAEHDIRINAVAPSLAMHPFLEKATGPELLESLRKREAFGRAAEVWEVANVIVFLASDLSSYMTGEIVPVSSQRA